MDLSRQIGKIGKENGGEKMVVQEGIHLDDFPIFRRGENAI
jgi:hypothetical protein